MKKLIPIFILIVIVIIYSVLLTNYQKIEQTDESIELINNIKNTIDDENIDDNFLTWIYENYQIDALKKIDSYLENNQYDENIWHKATGNSYLVLNDLYNNAYNNMDNVKIINTSKENTISFVGDVSLADNWYIMPKYDERNKGIYGILSEDTVKVMTETDIMVINSEFTISDRGEKIPKLYNFKASPKRIPIYNEMGADLLTLANNHVYDYGKEAFYDMLDSLNEYKIPYIGAGKNIDEAKEPYYFILNGYKIAFINATRAEKNIKTPEATETEGGVFRCYDPEPLKKVISETKKNSDYIILLVHWGSEDSHELEDVQIDTSKTYLDAGADVIVGTHAHVLQGIDFYNHKPIIYNLGDFIFNNETKDTGIFQIKLNDNGEMQYYFIPAKQENEYTKLLYDNERERVINNINSWSHNATINKDGEITEK